MFRKISGGVNPDYQAAEAVAAVLAYVRGIKMANSLEVDRWDQALKAKT